MPERDGPLLYLARKMLSLGPPSLSVLVARLGELEEYEDFISLVREFLPEREGDIFQNSTPASQMAAFASYFEDRYFPIDDMIKIGELESYYELTRAIPTIVRGFSWDDYHEIASSDWRPGIQLMTYLIESPYQEGDARIALAEACEEHVPVNILLQVPEGGISPPELHRILDDTPHKALALWGSQLWYDTGNFFLDTDYEMLWSGGELLSWDRETVEELTRQWQQADRIEQEISDLMDWLEGDPTTRFGEILNFILERR